MQELGTSVALGAELDGKAVPELDAIYREHAAVVSTWVRRMWGPTVHATVDPEDLLHEVFLVVQRRLATFRGESALTTWLYGITVLVVNARRKKERWRRWLWRRAEPEIQLDHDATARDDFGRAEAVRQVYAVLDGLSERDRTLLILFELERLPGSEVAAIVQISEANLWVALGRARTRFKQTFAARFGSEDASEGASHGI